MLDVGESSLHVGEQTVGETTRRRNDWFPSETHVANCCKYKLKNPGLPMYLIDPNKTEAAP